MLNKLKKQIIKNIYTKWLKEDKLIMLEGLEKRWFIFRTNSF